VSWILPTATARYVVDLAAEDAGPVLQDWTDGEVRTWPPSDQHSFDTPPDRLPSELSALGTRQVRSADLIVDHGGALVGARLVWPLGGSISPRMGRGPGSPHVATTPRVMLSSCWRLRRRASTTW
jgi:hypothetical protein